jgi:hypothetical protein
MRAADDYVLTLWLAKRPVFCCGCWCLQREDAQRTRRVLRFVRAVMKDWEEGRRMRK